MTLKGDSYSHCFVLLCCLCSTTHCAITRWISQLSWTREWRGISLAVIPPSIMTSGSSWLLKMMLQDHNMARNEINNWPYAYSLLGRNAMDFGRWRMVPIYNYIASHTRKLCMKCTKCYSADVRRRSRKVFLDTLRYRTSLESKPK